MPNVRLGRIRPWAIIGTREDGSRPRQTRGRRSVGALPLRRRRSHPADAEVRRKALGRRRGAGAGLSTGGFLAAALRTGLATRRRIRLSLSSSEGLFMRAPVGCFRAAAAPGGSRLVRAGPPPRPDGNSGRCACPEPQTTGSAGTAGTLPTFTHQPVSRVGAQRTPRASSRATATRHATSTVRTNTGQPRWS
jgi:hypothetical protein